MKPRSGFRLALAALAVALYGPGGHGATYRWVDENGAVHYSDRVPPDQAKHRRAKLNSEGREVEVLDGAKSPEQIEMENRLGQLRLEQEKILAAQRDRDQVLLRTYRSEEEMNLALQGKLTMLDSLIKVTEANRQRQQALLSGQENRAADFEKKGQAIPKNLSDAIEATRRQVAGYDGKLTRMEAEKNAISETFAGDIARFRSINAQHQGAGWHQAWHESVSASDKPDAGGAIVSAVNCAAGATCDKAWTLARAYLLQQANGPLFIDNDKILQTAIPRNDRDFAITVTRMAGKAEDILFLDIRCRPSSVGEELCASSGVRKIRADFRPYIEAGLAGSG